MEIQSEISDEYEGDRKFGTRIVNFAEEYEQFIGVDSKAHFRICALFMDPDGTRRLTEEEDEDDGMNEEMPDPESQALADEDETNPQNYYQHSGSRPGSPDDPFDGMPSLLSQTRGQKKKGLIYETDQPWMKQGPMSPLLPQQRTLRPERSPPSSHLPSNGDHYSDESNRGEWLRRCEAEALQKERRNLYSEEDE